MSTNIYPLEHILQAFVQYLLKLSKLVTNVITSLRTSNSLASHNHSTPQIKKESTVLYVYCGLYNTTNWQLYRGRWRYQVLHLHQPVYPNLYIWYLKVAYTTIVCFICKNTFKHVWIIGSYDCWMGGNHISSIFFNNVGI